jgi:hypothetical protein
MTLDPDKLTGAIDELHQTLKQIPAPMMNDSSRALLRELLVDIGRLLPGATAQSGAPAQPAAAAAPAASEPTHHNRLEDLAAGFEAEHPALTANLRQIADVLGKGGI